MFLGVTFVLVFEFDKYVSSIYIHSMYLLACIDIGLQDLRKKLMILPINMVHTSSLVSSNPIARPSNSE